MVWNFSRIIICKHLSSKSKLNGEKTAHVLQELCKPLFGYLKILYFQNYLEYLHGINSVHRERRKELAYQISLT